MKIILTRHGETIENRMGIAQGHLPGKLTEKGIGQAKKLALRLKDEKFDAIYSSDLARAADTAKEIIKFHPNVNAHFVKELRERNIGEFEGTKWCDFELE
jgi:probable phosphoglycerate mutase